MFREVKQESTFSQTIVFSGVNFQCWRLACLSLLPPSGHSEKVHIGMHSPFLPLFTPVPFIKGLEGVRHTQVLCLAAGHGQARERSHASVRLSFLISRGGVITTHFLPLWGSNAIIHVEHLSLAPTQKNVREMVIIGIYTQISLLLRKAVLYPFHRWGTWGSEKSGELAWSYLAKPVMAKTRIQVWPGAASPSLGYHSTCSSE